ncbi:MAG: DNA alkylation response protein, partial [Rhizobium sp.]|nr:DNA alkylation response protein [Rhizobium sp.]
MRERFSTHVVENQPPGLAPCDAWATDLPLREALGREGGGWAEAEIAAYGALAGGEMMEWGRLANEHRPCLQSFDRQGRRIDQVEFHPAYHQLMASAVAHGVPNFAWRHAGRPGAPVARAALMLLHNQADAGT